MLCGAITMTCCKVLGRRWMGVEDWAEAVDVRLEGESRVVMLKSLGLGK